ncbi:laminin subunit gamma-2 [Stegastes partitus]|uniref:Laminin subunit gamma-2 n=1 Tax=Stegastes partitus TaxID=144197 RepID=A0A9Y4MTA9_9TELE|nr:PREDICTED: laminin subunit gamma-2 [Stegastes partitus]XP_008273913.1 PREDICTED: laminin subunit gamma-2 [Stegastes partitus]
MKSGWISLYGLLAAVCSVQATYRYYSTLRCDCNGRSRYCLPDAWGLHCIDCQGNYEGRHCERCKDGFYQQEAGLSCSPCRCNPAGSITATCDSRGRCRCKEGVTGEKCERCPDGPIGPDGCSQRRQLREDSESLTLPCFCYGHSTVCSPQSGYSVYNITSTFADGPEGWKAATVHGFTPNDVHFRWSPKHQDLEVISRNSLPIYLYAPEPYLGNQLLSYRQNLSFSLRLDRGVRHPSTSDVILEGGGLRVTTSLGDLRSIVPCGQKIKYSFRLDEQPDSRWRPQISSFQFQKLLQNLTSIKIRTTFGETGRGYLDNVQLVSARPADGVPARWVQACSCPPGYDGLFCERCAAGFRRRSPADGAFGRCEHCSCTGGSCDPQTGDCYSADETPAERSCSEGFYRDPWRPDRCMKCPCPDGVSCSVPAGSLEPRCDRCPPGTTGPRCDSCQEGFYGDPTGVAGVQRPCKPCSCNGHIDVSVAGSCDRVTGECLKCLNNTRGQSCEFCERSYYHSRPSDACKACNCDLRGSESNQCDDSGRCRCRSGFEGLRCQRSNCPACFSPIKVKMEGYATKVKELETLFSDMDGGLKPANSAEIEAALRAAEDVVDDLQDDTKLLAEMEKRLQTRLSAISRSQLSEEQDIQNIADKADDIKQQQQMYKMKVEEVQMLTEEMKRKLDEAKSKLRAAELPLGDAPLGSNALSSLVQTATDLAGKHQTQANIVEKTANEALSDSNKGLALVRTLMNRENKVKELIGDLKTMYDQTSARVKGLEDQAARLSGEAKDESKVAAGMLKGITSMERNIPSPMKEEADAMVSRLDGVKKAVDDNISGFEDLQGNVQRNTAAAEDLLVDGKAAQKEFGQLLERVNAAKGITEGALPRINGYTNDLLNTLNTLKSFDQQIDGSKSLADAAISRLPGINNTIQQAVRNNAETLSALGDVSKDYDSALGAINVLSNLVNNLELTTGSLPSHAGLANKATKLNGEAKDLKQKVDGVAGDLALKLDNAKRLEGSAEKVAFDAAAAFNNARQTRDTVGKTLQNIHNLLASMNQPDAVNEEDLKRLEDTLANAQRDMEGSLRPRLKDMERLEAAQRSRLTGINQDIDTILADINNLEDILRSIPNGCYNSPPIEEA